jgi:hypothetical protein
MHYNADDRITERQFKQVLIALKNKDKNLLKAMFSKKVLEESNLIDNDIDYLFNFFQGDVISWNQDGGPIVDLNINYGERLKEMKSFFKIYTSEQKYLVFILDYYEDTAHPENVGLYTLRIIKMEDEETQFGYWQDMKISGIYNPLR